MISLKHIQIHIQDVVFEETSDFYDCDFFYDSVYIFYQLIRLPALHVNNLIRVIDHIDNS
jgi:hypothetical protein